MSNALTLYKVDARKRVNLDDLVPDGVEFYQAIKKLDDNGVETGEILLTPVNLVTTTVKRAAADDKEQAA